MVEITMKLGGKPWKATLHPVKADNTPGPLDGAPEWIRYPQDNGSPNPVGVVVAGGGLSADLVAQTYGAGIVEVVADVALGTSRVELKDQIKVTVPLPDPVVSLGLTVEEQV